MRYKLIGSIIIILISFSTLPVAHAQQVIYLIRHAEQELHVFYEPLLTEAGHQRAKVWGSILRDAGIKVIYTSEKRRTIQTGEHIAQALNIPMESVPRIDVLGLARRLRNRHADDVVLIITHLYTIPKLLTEFGHSEYVTLQRKDYDNLFVIVPNKYKNEPVFLRLRY